MQSGFGVNFLFWPGEFWETCRRISQRILMANFDSEFLGLVFPGFQATQKIHAQNSRPEMSAFLSNFTFLNPKFIHGDFLLTGETKIYCGAACCETQLLLHGCSGSTLQSRLLETTKTSLHALKLFLLRFRCAKPLELL